MQKKLKRGDRFDAVIHFHDECPKLGQGLRPVHVKVGNKVVYLTSPTSGKTARLKRAVFEEMLAKSGKQPLDQPGEENKQPVVRFRLTSMS